MKKVQTRTLIGPALDWAVAICEGYTDWCGETEKFLPPRKEYGWVRLYDLNYSTDWVQGGPIIDREINVIEKRSGYWYAWRPKRNDGYVTPTFATVPDSREAWAYGDTILIATMRCYVASKMGEEIEIPDELLT